MSNPPALIWTQPPPPGRQRSLGRPEIVEAAIALADAEGAAAVTMKAVAARLGDYSPMALYRYVHSKDGLTDLMLDAAAAQIPLPAAPGQDWRQDIRAVALRTRAMTRQHPWYPLLFHTRPPAGPHQMARTEFLLAVLTTQGASTADAMTYAALVDRHVIGAGLQEAAEAEMSRRLGLHDETAVRTAFAAVRDLAQARGLPILAGWLARPAGPAADEQFELGLGFLLDGIAGRIG